MSLLSSSKDSLCCEVVADRIRTREIVPACLLLEKERQALGFGRGLEIATWFVAIT
jgi:hypothetical protein